MAAQLKRFEKSEGVVFIGKAQEKTPVFRTERRRNPNSGQQYPWIVRSTVMVNHYYWYCLDREFGPFFLKFCSYFPYNAKLCLNGHEYAKCQLRQEGSNTRRWTTDWPPVRPEAAPNHLRPIGARANRRSITEMLDQLPHPYTLRDREAGYRYDLSILQAEFR